MADSGPQSLKPREQSRPKSNSSGNISAPASSLEGTLEPGTTFVSMGVIASAPVDNDEVQFIFAAPRRRKKKRRKLESSRTGLQVFQGTSPSTRSPLATSPAAMPRDDLQSSHNEQQSCPVTSPVADSPANPTVSIAIPPGLPRRASTGIVSLESGLSAYGQPMQATTSSLPSIPRPSIATPSLPPPPAANHQESQTNKGDIEPEPFTDFPDSMDWWTDEIPSIQNNDPVQIGWNFFPPDFLPKKKRKRANDHDFLISDVTQPVSPMGLPIVPTSLSDTPNFVLLRTTDEEGSNLWATSPNIVPNVSNHTPLPNASPKSPNYLSSFQTPIAADPPPTPATHYPPLQVPTMKFPPVQAPAVTALPPQEPIYEFILPQPQRQDNFRQNSFHVPAASVPDESVSPRTRTVEISRPSNPSPYRSPYSTANGESPTPSKQPNGQTSIPSSNPRAAPSVAYQRPATNPSDLLRRPSLYKIPPWPAQDPPKAPTTLSPAVRKTTNTFHQIYRGINPSTTNRPETQSSAQNTSTTTPPSTPPRKHAPNLVVDIAETCQATFPFAEVAARHNAPIQKVIDTFSAVIQLPLLRHATDNRRPGSVGQRRLKEFRDAKKAMEKAMMEKEKKSKTNERKGPGLVKEACFNSQTQRELGA